MYDIVCEICGKHASVRSPLAKTCSPECRQALKRKNSRESARRKAKSGPAGGEAICPYCGKAFIRQSVGQIYCSQTCSGRSAATRDYGSGICEMCGEPFVKHTVKQKFCSTACRDSSRNEKVKLWRKEHPIETREPKQPKKEEPKRIDTTAILCAEAKRRGISYGQLQGEKYLFFQRNGVV